jgi:hypothetical protein
MLKYLKVLTRHAFFLIVFVSSWSANAQGTFFFSDDVSERINFEFINNLIIIPLEINSVTLSFLLDTGVTKPILFNLTERDSLDLKDSRAFYLRGLGGDGQLKALKSRYNRFKLGNAVSTNQDLYVVYDTSIDFTSRLGVLVHGIIGYDIFKDFVIEINYKSKFIRLHKPNSFRPRSSKKWKTLPINIHRRKPYLDAIVTVDTLKKPTKLLIDTGSSDALWLFENKEQGLIPKKNLVFMDYLGKGLSGSIYGKRSRVNEFKLSDFNLKDVNVAFPDSLSIDVTKVYKERSGSIGSGILKRFNLFFDYTNKKLHLKKNGFFRERFTYNNSGIVLEHNGSMFVKEEIKVPVLGSYNSKDSRDAVQINLSMNYNISLKPTYKIVEVRPTSNAYKTGLRVGDVLIDINSKPAYNFKLAEINKILHGKTGKSIRLKIERDGEIMVFKFKLDNVFKKVSPHSESS